MQLRSLRTRDSSFQVTFVVDIKRMLVPVPAGDILCWTIQHYSHISLRIHPRDCWTSEEITSKDFLEIQYMGQDGVVGTDWKVVSRSGELLLQVGEERVLTISHRI